MKHNIAEQDTASMHSAPRSAYVFRCTCMCLHLCAYKHVMYELYIHTYILIYVHVYGLQKKYTCLFGQAPSICLSPTLTPCQLLADCRSVASVTIHIPIC